MFDGNCAAAFEFYKSVFGGDFIAYRKFSDGPPELSGNPEIRDWIMHVSLPVGSSILMASDTVPGSGPPLKAGNNFAISYLPTSRGDADAKFKNLSKDGVVTMEIQETFWNSYFGSCIDQFGTHWMINLPLEAQ